MLSIEDRYVFLGKAKRNSEAHAQMMRAMKGGDEKAQLACWGRKATGEMVADHAIGLVFDEGKSRLYDDGFTGGSKDFTIERSKTTLLIRELPGSEYMKSKELNVQDCLKRTVATVVAE